MMIREDDPRLGINPSFVFKRIHVAVAGVFYLHRLPLGVLPQYGAAVI